MKESHIKFSHRVEDYDGFGGPDGHSGLAVILAVVVLIAIGFGIAYVVFH